MSRLASFFRSSGTDSDSDNESPEQRFAQERQDLSNAMDWAGLIMNDDIDGAWNALQQGDSSFHALGSAVTIFMRSILGFEKSLIADTTVRLAECETKAGEDYKRAQRYAGHGSGLYPAGTQYQLATAETQLMSAVVGVLNESIIEAMKSFYKLRKAYITLEGIAAIETQALSKSSRYSEDTSRDVGGDGEGDSTSDASSDSDLSEKGSSRGRPSSDGTPPSSRNTSAGQPYKESKSAAWQASQTGNPVDAPNPDLLQDPIDAFIHSGTDMCFGILLLILTLVPPAFSRILSVVGFRGDRARGLQMLWQSAAYPNVHGAVAGMVLLQYYHGYLGRVDILPDKRDFDKGAEVVGPPDEKLARLLASMRSRYPDSKLWLKEESKQYVQRKDLQGAIDVLRSGEESKIEQITALNTFELSLNAMFIQDWALMGDSFEECLRVNDWSPATYTYMVGCATVELYRDAYHSLGSDADETKRLKTEAEKHLRKAPTLAGKKRLFAQQLPLETFLIRKMARWEQRSKETGVDLADAVGSSPALEMCYMWSGHKRMDENVLRQGIENLKWERCTAPSQIVGRMKADEDELAVWSLSMAAVLGRLGRYDEAKGLLRDNVLRHDRSVFKGSTKDDYVLPTATYEMGLIEWTECCNPPADLSEMATQQYRKATAEQCQKYLETAAGWESFVLDSRIGLRAHSGLLTLKWFKGKMES